MSDPTGNWPKWVKKLAVAVAVVAVVAVVAAVTVTTAGAGTAIAAVAVGAAKGAAIGLVGGAVSGAAIGYLSTGTLEGTLNGMADGALSGAISGGIAGATSHATRVANADPVKTALKELDSSGLRPGQTQLSRSRVMELVDNFDSIKANSSIYSDGATRYIVDGHHTTVASTILGRGNCMNMGTVTTQLPSATNVYWTKKWYEFGKTVIKIID